MSLVSLLLPSKTGSRSLTYPFAYPLARAEPLVCLLSLVACNLFSTQGSNWDLENVNWIMLHPSVKHSNASHHLEENLKSSKWSTRPYLVWPFLLSQFLTLYFLICCHYTGISSFLEHVQLNPVQDLCTCSSFSPIVTYLRCKHSLISPFTQASLQKGLLWLPELEHQVALMATYCYIVYFFECFLSIKIQAPMVRDFIFLVWVFIALVWRVPGTLKVFTLWLLSKWMRGSSCLQSNEYWYLDLTSNHSTLKRSYWACAS